MGLGPFTPQFGLAPAAAGATQITNTTLSTVIGYAPPPNALGFFLQTNSTNGTNVRWRLGLAATATAGHQLEAGRDTGLIPFAGPTLSLCSESGTNEIQLTWLTSV